MVMTPALPIAATVRLVPAGVQMGHDGLKPRQPQGTFGGMQPKRAAAGAGRQNSVPRQERDRRFVA